MKSCNWIENFEEGKLRSLEILKSAPPSVYVYLVFMIDVLCKPLIEDFDVEILDSIVLVKACDPDRTFLYTHKEIIDLLGDDLKH